MRTKKKQGKSNDIQSPEFGKRVRAVRKHLKLKQQEMADNLNISLPTLSCIENGKSYPCYDFFYNMIAHYKVNLYYLFFGKEEMFKTPGKYVPSKDTDTDADPIEKELRLILSRDDLREFFHYFLGSRVIQYHILSEFFEFISKKRQDIDMEMKSPKDSHDFTQQWDYTKFK